MRNPSTGDSAAPPEAAADQPPDPRADTRSNVKGQAAPREPHERDESSDSGTGAPSDVMRKGHDDVVSGKTGTDKGEATDEVYGRTLRDKTPGAERD